MNNAFVVALGLGTTFFGLICIVLLIKLMSALIPKPAPAAAKPETSAAAPVAAPSADPNLIAVISCALAEELGTDVSNVVVTSIEKA